MLTVPGTAARLCDGLSRRDLLRVGGISLMGLSIPNMLALQAAQAAEAKGGGSAGAFGKAKSVIYLFLQGGPSHIDIWDPKPDAPDNIRGKFKPIPTKIPGTMFAETMPLLAQQMHRATLIRSVSYTPAGLFNHTAAMYQMVTGFTPDKVAPSGQLDPPSPSDYPHGGSHIAKMRPPDDAMLPFVMLPRPMQESNVINKGGTAGFLGKAYDPYYLFPTGDDTDQEKMNRVKVDDLVLRADVNEGRLERRQGLRKSLDAQMPEVERAVEKYALNKYYSTLR